ncbi:MAG: GHKL domain-containing protein [Lachnospiraceae bacterium]|nr:GHKL domain-containing protein [Lachnospiraceae bacterium]
MIIFIQSICIVFTEMIFYKLFMEAFCDYRSSSCRRKSYIMLIVMSIGTFVISFLLNSYFLLKEIAIALCLFLIAGLFFKSRPFKMITLTIFYLALLLAVDYLVLVTYSSMFVVIPGDETIFRIAAMAFSKITLFLIVLVIQRITEKSEIAALTDIQWVRFLFFPVFSVCILGIILTNTYAVHAEGMGDLLWMVAFGLLGMNIFLFFLIQDISKRERQFRENKIAEVQANNQLTLYQSIADNFNEQNGKLHEYKNQIECMRTLCRGGKYDELEEYLSQIGDEIFHELDAVDTHHAIVNAVINTKYRKALSYGIVVVFKLDDLSGLWLSEHDVVVLLANLLDNAIEACAKIENRRVIKIKMVIEKSFLVLSVCNTYNGTVKRKEGVLLSTKEHVGYEHGIGVKNIIKIVEKYGGHYIMEPQDTEFLFSIMIPQKGKTAD